MIINENSCYYCGCNMDTCSKRSITNPAQKYITLSLSLTDRCNESCSFCWHFNKLTQLRPDMSRYDIDVLWDYLDKDFSDYSVVFAFIGGEPTLNLPIIDYALSEAVRRRGRHFGRIFTNGMEGVHDIMVLLKKYNLKVQVSLPHKSSHNFEERKENAKKYIELQNGNSIEFSIVAEDSDLDELYDTVKFWRDLGVRILMINFNCLDIPIEDEDAQTEKLINILESLRDLENPNFYLMNLIYSSSTGYGGFVKEDIMLDYFSDNKFYPTHYVESKEIGDVFKGLDLDLFASIWEKNVCEGCPHWEVCTHPLDPHGIQQDLSLKVIRRLCPVKRANRVMLNKVRDSAK